MNRQYLCELIIKILLTDLFVGGISFFLRPLNDIFFWIGLAAAVLMVWLVTLELVLLFDTYANGDDG